MITPAYVRTMAAYNRAINRTVFEAAARLDEAARQADRGAFWRSIHGTLSHLAWADQQWMGRFDGWDKPAVPLADSARYVPVWDDLQATRASMDARIERWAATVRQDWLDGELDWFSGAAQKRIVRPCALLVVHLFNHQAHHRGQAHALITAAGEQTGPTDFFLLVP